MCTLNNKDYLCIVDYHSKFSVIRKTENLSTDRGILACKIIFSGYGLPKKIMSDAGCNFVSDKFKQFCKNLNIEQATSLSYHCQSNGQIEVCIEFIKCTMYIDTKTDIHIALLHIKTAALEPGLPSSFSLLFNHPVCGIVPIINRLATSSSYHHQSNGQVVCIEFIKCTMCIDTKTDILIALLHLKTAPLEPGLPSSFSLLFSHPIWGIMPIINRLPSNSNSDDEHYEAQDTRQTSNFKNYDTYKSYDSFSVGLL